MRMSIMLLALALAGCERHSAWRAESRTTGALCPEGQSPVVTTVNGEAWFVCRPERCQQAGDDQRPAPE